MATMKIQDSGKSCKDNLNYQELTVRCGTVGELFKAPAKRSQLSATKSQANFKPKRLRASAGDRLPALMMAGRKEETHEEADREEAARPGSVRGAAAQHPRIPAGLCRRHGGGRGAEEKGDGVSRRRMIGGMTHVLACYGVYGQGDSCHADFYSDVWRSQSLHRRGAHRSVQCVFRAGGG